MESKFKSEYPDFTIYADDLKVGTPVRIHRTIDGEDCWEEGSIAAIARSDSDDYDNRADEIMTGSYSYAGEFDDHEHSCFVYVGVNVTEKKRIKITNEKNNVITTLLMARLSAHLGHDVSIVRYGKDNYCLECDDCNEIIFDTDVYDLTGRSC